MSESTAPKVTADVVGRRIAAARILAGLTPLELATTCGWNPQKLYRFERGEQVPDAIELGAIASATGRSVDWLLNGDGDPV